MALSEALVGQLARVLDQGMRQATELERITASHPELSLADAYLIQAEGIRLRESRGEKRIGLKMGLTSQAKREQMGLGLPIYGVLTDQMQVLNAHFSLAGKIHPKIEPEIAFLTGKELRGKISIEEAYAACIGTCSAMEILDSRFRGFKYFSLPDVVADNSSSAYFILGEWKMGNPHALQLSELSMEMLVNGQVVQSARADAISGDPIRSLVQLCDLLAETDQSLPAGSIVLAGAATAAVALEAGMRVELRVASLPSVFITID